MVGRNAETTLDRMRRELVTPGPAGTGLEVRSWGLTARGGRDFNEDHFLVAKFDERVLLEVSNLPWNASGGVLRRPAGPVLLAVADGMGGHAGGEIASEIAIRCLLESLLDRSAPREWADRIGDGIRSADEQIFKYGDLHPGARQLGTTVTAAVIFDGRLYLGHAGDSRCYLIRRGNAQLLTSDHTFAEVIRRGAGLDNVLEMPRLRNALVNVAGGVEEGVRVELHERPLRAGDTIVLCTDGVSSFVNEGRIVDVVERAHSPRSAAETLLDDAVEAGTDDDVTVVVARVHDGGWL